MADIRDTVNQFCEETDSDLLFYFGAIRGPEDDQIMDACHNRQRRTNVVLLLTTYGGDPHAAYRIGRCLQAHYAAEAPVPTLGAQKKKSSGTFSVFVNNVCKSAGTILSCGADKVYMTKRAEFGPIDIQLRKTDEVGERTSGLTPMQALGYLQNQSVALFKRHFLNLRFDEELLFSTKMAAEVATNVTIGLLPPIYSQLDPVRLAEVDRYLRISSEYARRLATKNLQPKALERLLGDYPSHAFVIDRREAEEIFVTVEDPPTKLYAIGELWREMANNYLAGDEPFFFFVNDWSKPKTEPKTQEEEKAEDKKETADAAQNADGQSVRDPDRNQPSAYAGRNFKAIERYSYGLAARKAPSEIPEDP